MFIQDHTTFQADFRLGCRGGFPTDLYDRRCGTQSRGEESHSQCLLERIFSCSPSRNILKPLLQSLTEVNSHIFSERTGQASSLRTGTEASLGQERHGHGQELRACVPGWGLRVAGSPFTSLPSLLAGHSPSVAPLRGQ